MQYGALNQNDDQKLEIYISKIWAILVDPTGFEPVTSSLPARRSAN